MKDAPVRSLQSNMLADEAALPREVLDVDYNARASVPTAVFEENMRRYRAESQACRRAFLEKPDLVYDEVSGQVLDILGNGVGKNRPVFVFIHGGYWRALSKDDSMFMAGSLARQGIATAVVDYRLAPAVSIGEIVREVRAACAFVWRNGKDLGIDIDRIFIGGSSAGAHLAAMALCGGWHEEYGVPENIIKGALLVSGLYHLGPIAKCFAQEWARLDESAVRRLSPAENLPIIQGPVTVAFASREPAGFTRQSRGYGAMLREFGVATDVLEIPGRNHFDIILDLAKEDAELTKRLVRKMS